MPQPQPPPDLVTSQHRFAQALLDTAQFETTLSLLSGDTTIMQKRLAIYRGNVVVAATKSLALAYPVIQQIVGEEFFSGLARAYWQQTPSSSGNLHEYGASFSSFVAAFPHTLDFPYLPDMARLEWAVHLAASAADASTFDPQCLTGFSEAQLPHLRFGFTPGLSVLGSSYPVVQIWTVHQTGYAAEFEIDWDQQQTALIYRDGMRVEICAIDAGQQAALISLLAGETLSAAFDTAYAVQSDFDIQTALARWIQSGWISSVSCDGV